MSSRPRIGTGLRLALDFGPVLAFFVVNAFAGIYWATGAVMLAVTVSLAIGYAIERKLAPVPLVSFALVLVFGGLTLWLQDETFVKIRPTIFYALAGSVLLIGLAFGYSLLKLMLQAALRMEEQGWRLATLLWGGFFLLLAVVNELVWRNVATDTWVAYNTWGDTALTFLFAVVQAVLLQRYVIEDPEGEPPRR